MYHLYLNHGNYVTIVPLFIFILNFLVFYKLIVVQVVCYDYWLSISISVCVWKPMKSSNLQPRSKQRCGFSKSYLIVNLCLQNYKVFIVLASMKYLMKSHKSNLFLWLGFEETQTFTLPFSCCKNWFFAHTSHKKSALIKQTASKKLNNLPSTFDLI